MREDTKDRVWLILFKENTVQNACADTVLEARERSTGKENFILTAGDLCRNLNTEFESSVELSLPIFKL